MVELLTEVHLLEEKQTVEFKAQKLKVGEQYAKSRARVKIFEDLEGDNVNPAISHNSKIGIAYSPVNNRKIESGMMPTRKFIIPKKFEAHQRNVEAHQVPAMSLHDIKIGDECSNIKAMLSSAEPTDMLCKLLKVPAPDVDIECFDGNVLEYHYVMALFRVVESKIEDPRGRLIKYTVRDARDLIKTASNFHPIKVLLRQSTS